VLRVIDVGAEKAHVIARARGLEVPGVAGHELHHQATLLLASVVCHQHPVRAIESDVEVKVAVVLRRADEDHRPGHLAAGVANEETIGVVDAV
jgi:hypothetical protein